MPEIFGVLERIIEWTKLKCQIQAASPHALYVRERKIWRASIGANIGSEQNGKNDLFERPVLILKILYGGTLILAAPLRSGGQRGDYYVQTQYRKKVQSIILAQIMVISTKRLIRKLRVLPHEEFSQVRERLKRWL